MNKFFLSFLVLLGLVRAGEVLQPLIPLSPGEALKQAAFWVPAGVACQATSYFLRKLEQYHYNERKTQTWSEYFSKKYQNTKVYWVNSGISVLKCGASVLGDQTVANVVTVLSSRRPNNIEISIPPFLMRYYYFEKKPDNFFQYANELVASTATPFAFRSFIENGFPDLKTIPIVLPGSGKVWICNKLLELIITLYCGPIKQIRACSELNRLLFLQTVFLTFELAEYVIKGWSGKYHLNDRTLFSLHWALAIPFMYYWIKNGNTLPCAEIELKQKIKPIRENVDKAAVRDDSCVFAWSRAKRAENLITINDYDKIRIEFGFCRSRYLSELEREKEKQRRYENNFLQYKQKQHERSKVLFFYNIIALIAGICFHALLDSGLYWYQQYCKV